MTYSHEVERMCPLTKGPNHGPAPIPEEGQWVKAYQISDISGLTHDAHTKDTTLHSMLAAMKYPDYPVALGVIRSVEDEIVYDQAVEKQVEEVKAQSKIHCVDDLLHSGATWEI